MDKHEQKLDQAARAAWLSYVGGRTQDEIAAHLGVSRPGVQRLLALARQEGLVRLEIDHPIAGCMAMSQAIAERFGLEFCDVVPAMPQDSGSEEDVTRLIGQAGAKRLLHYLKGKTSLTLSLGSGRTMRATVEALERIERPQHRFVSLVGNIARDGSANRHDGMMVLADKTGGTRFLLPAPIFAATEAEKEALLSQHLLKVVERVALEAEAGFLGIGRIDRQATLFQNHFISEAERDELLRAGAVGELLGWPLNDRGQLVDTPITQRLTSLPLPRLERQLLIGLAGGSSKGPAVLAALRGGWLGGLVTDETAARYILHKEGSQHG
ncbi:sugar-binding transcriptional regulator [Kushneria aurantia]|uniref:Sugar-binding transcriptional regulator n=1 Tax=Kushneria aurantia TaxID=504092 RepID=A0ABV6FYM5_9GAMM|nr:sugar-binding transcriptional regulator [Kushneria aurantia]